VKRIGFAFNPTHGGATLLRERALAWCAAHGVDGWSSEASDLDALLSNLSGTDALVVLGCDGTFLRAVRASAAMDVPILGVNSGKVGFLSKAESEALEEVLGFLVRGRFRIQPRMALEARVLRGGATPDPESHLGMNESAVVRGSQARVVRLKVSIAGSHLATYTCDGLVVSTPTGSTGYSFSAGGPVLEPTSRNLIVTPIAAYLSALRSVVVGPHDAIRVHVLDAFDCLVSIDGREDVALEVGDVVVISARERPICFIEPQGALAFWDLLRQKAALLPAE
jgi:NAD+ kinase